MSFFSTILQKLGLKKEEPAATPPAAAPAQTTSTPAPAKPPVGYGPTTTASTAAAPKPAGAGTLSDRRVQDDMAVNHEPMKPAVKAISEVDVVKHLESLGAGSGLDWKVSIVDLLKLLDIDSSREARNELAKELGCPEDLMHDSAKMNVWLHKTVLKKIAENGGNIPASMLD
ncbi:MAG TPA: DUF3597 domain-containing protein [Anaerolineales bacterium]|nr:DUF3597 domain-containing protein [Anaerolineales bacterium]HMV97536.1 DUF3597 domain-containing protein [Anaerolineales bacterium]HMX17869.1 DUF3597 domain-containing protein [Anaerolineales bacterium]HMX72811.1 DUF3597 domain-containing protein [Anaerolineales bacterium]HMZ43876.1 DUF3597 domain-containing protein [Anaerolineales bacterium]